MIFYLILTTAIILACPNTIWAKNYSYNECVLKIHGVLKTSALHVVTNDEGFDETFAEDFIKVLSKKHVPVKISTNVDQIKEEQDWNSIVLVFVPRCESLLDLAGKIIYGVKYLIQLHLDCPEQLTRVRVYLSNFDVTVITTSGQLLTFIPTMNARSCTVRAVRRYLNDCTKDFEQLSHVFPKKIISNFQRCPLKISIERSESYAIFDRSPYTIPGTIYSINQALYGSDVMIFKDIDRYANSTSMFLYYVSENDNRDSKYLMDGTFDAMAGCQTPLTMSYDLNYLPVGYTQPYNAYSIGWIYFVKRSPRSYEAMLEKLDKIYYFALFYFIFPLAWYILRKYDGNFISLSNSYLVCWGALIGTTSLQDAKSLKQKVLSMSYMFESIHFVAFVTTQLYTFLVVQQPPQMYSTLNDLIDSGKTFYVEKGWSGVTTAHYKSNRVVHCPDAVSCLFMAQSNSGVTVGATIWYPNFVLNSTVNDEAQVLRLTESLLQMSVHIFTPRHGARTRIIHTLISRLHESGIAKRYNDYVLGFTLLREAQRLTENIMNNDVSCESGCSIHLDEVAIMFYMWFGGCGIAIVTFIIEIVCFRMRKRF